jgi:acetyl-CoA carboxylase biotin carboxylase subunit
MIKRLLIANRGEIAVRIIRTCREMGIETVAVYSEADRDCLHRRMADRALCIGPAPAATSYLNPRNLVEAALATQSDAVHPGVGFLSENAAFAQMVEDAGLFFIGPRPETIELLGDKVRARSTAKQYGLPITPGTENAVNSLAEAEEALEKLGFPVIIKAASGGGGKGMRIVRNRTDYEYDLELCRQEALANFADGRVFIERYLENPRHVELQLLGDGCGNVAVLGERDCTIQRRHQKLIEESPSPALPPEVREEMSLAASALFKALKYRGAGTIEFLLDTNDTNNGNDKPAHYFPSHYFMEVNARIQVEHPVSEFVTGLDLIEAQIRACTEECLPIAPGIAETRGHSIECRINAQGTGTVERLEVPGGPGVRFASFLYTGYKVPPYYDSMLGKLIVQAPDREAALRKMDRALAELVIEGIPVNTEEQRKIINDPTFRKGRYGTSFLE